MSFLIFQKIFTFILRTLLKIYFVQSFLLQHTSFSAEIVHPEAGTPLWELFSDTTQPIPQEGMNNS